MSHNKIERFSTLDSFRGLAAICVVLFHMRLSILLPESTFIEHSWIFVEFFFILSGFVLTYSYGARKDLAFKQFIIGRTFRLFPLHYAVFLVVILLELFSLWASNYGIRFHNAPLEGRNSISQILPNLLLLQSWLPFANNLSFNAPSWSLSVEYYVYIIFFCTLLAKGQFRALIWMLLSITAFLLIVLTGIAKYQGVLRGLGCFFSGALCYLLYKCSRKRLFQSSPLVFSVLELASLAACIYIVLEANESKVVIASLVFISTIFIFSFEKGLVSTLLKARLFQWLGKLSYSIYMVHWAVLQCFVLAFALYQKRLAPFVFADRIDLGATHWNLLLAIAAMGITIACSTVTYRYIEKSFQNYGRRLLHGDKARILAVN